MTKKEINICRYYGRLLGTSDFLKNQIHLRDEIEPVTLSAVEAALKKIEPGTATIRNVIFSITNEKISFLEKENFIDFFSKEKKKLIYRFYIFTLQKELPARLALKKAFKREGKTLMLIADILNISEPTAFLMSVCKWNLSRLETEAILFLEEQKKGKWSLLDYKQKKNALENAKMLENMEG